MNQIVVLVPFKASRGKSRLSRTLNPAQRRRLQELMLADVLRVFRRVGLLPRCYVISSDVKVLTFARRKGARTISEPKDDGVNAAVATGMRTLGSDHDFMVVPLDLPLLTPAEVKTALALKHGFDCVISPSRSFNGTNLFIFSGEDAPTLSYDSDSFWSHVGGAARRGLSLAVCCTEGILADVDTPKDLRALSRARRRTLSVGFAKEMLKKRTS